MLNSLEPGPLPIAARCHLLCDVLKAKGRKEPLNPVAEDSLVGTQNQLKMMTFAVVSQSKWGHPEDFCVCQTEHIASIFFRHSLQEVLVRPFV